MTDAALLEDSDVCGTTANIGEDYSYVPLVGPYHSLGAGQRFQNQIFDVKAYAPDALDQVLDRAYGSGYDVGFHIEPEAVHPNRILHPNLTI